MHGPSENVSVEQGSSSDEIGELAMLDEELQQSTRFLEAQAVS